MSNAIDKEELLEILKDMKNSAIIVLKGQWKEEDERAYKQIATLINRTPKGVTEEWVEEIAEVLLDKVVDSPNPAHTDMQNATLFIRSMLKEIEVGVKNSI